MIQLKTEYKIYDSANRINEIIRTELKRKTSEKKNNLSGEFSENGGIDIYNNLSFFYSEPNLGPFIKLNLISVHTNENKSKLTLKRINGVTFKIHFLFAIFFTALTLIIAIYEIVENGFNKIEYLAMPIIGIIYLISIELIAEFKISRLIKTVDRIMINEKIEHKKL